MKKFLLKSGELICIVLLALFIVFISSREKPSEQKIEDVGAAVLSVCDTKELIEGDELRLKKQFGFEEGSFGDFIYYSSDSVMDVREVLILNFTDEETKKSVIEKMEGYIEEKQKLFDGYAPKESALLESHVLISERGYLLFYVGENAEEVSAVFKESL